MSSTVRTSILLLILVLLVSAFGYDRLVALKGRDQSRDSLNQLLDTADDYSEEDINDLFAKTGVVNKEGKYQKWVKYSWTRGTLVQTYDFYVRFAKKKDKWVATETSIEAPSDLPQENTDPVSGPDKPESFGAPPPAAASSSQKKEPDAGATKADEKKADEKKADEQKSDEKKSDDSTGK